MKIQDLMTFSKEVQGSSDGGAWHPIRFKSSENTFLLPRIKAALRVLLGKADALDWGDWE